MKLVIERHFDYSMELVNEKCYYDQNNIIRNCMTRQEALMAFAQGTREILKNNLSKLIVYGSYARGDYKEDSDIDVMILTPLSKEEIERIENGIFDLAFDLEMESGIVINPILENEEHYRYWLGAFPFYANVEKEGIVIVSNCMSVEEFEKQEQLLKLRTRVLQAELERINGVHTLSITEARKRLRKSQ